MATLEHILEQARSLTPDERRLLREALDREQAIIQSAPVEHASSGAREQLWVSEHRDEYLGQWVALARGRLIAHGHDARAVYRTAREAGINIPFVVRIEPYDEPSMGGWQ